MPQSLHGIVPALVTPFRPDARIDYGVWQAIIDGQIAAGVDGLFFAGSSGEFYALDFEERQILLRFARQAVAGRVPLYGNVGAISTRETIRLAQAAEADGVDVLVVVTPYYIQPSQDELAEHYIEICHSVRLPVLAYNFPQHGGVEMAADTLARIAASAENLAGIKDSSGRLEQTLAYGACSPARPLAVFAASEATILDALRGGCAGSVTACANIAPRLFVDLYSAFRAGRQAEAERLQALATALHATVGLHTFPSTIKHAMRLAGLPAGICRSPVGPVPPQAARQIAEAITKLQTEGYIDEPSGRPTEPVSSPARA